MPTLVIEKIEVITHGGHSASITGINTESSDCFVGSVKYGNGTESSIRWSLAGQARDHTHDYNIDTESDQLFETRNFADRNMSPDVIR